jgi:hypothetical protein
MRRLGFRLSPRLGKRKAAENAGAQEGPYEGVGGEAFSDQDHEDAMAAQPVTLIQNVVQGKTAGSVGQIRVAP